MADAPKFNVGDRIMVERSAQSRRVPDAIVVPRDTIQLTPEYATVKLGDWFTMDNVLVAHYAPPGVPMIAMTPERIAALEDAADAIDFVHLKRAADCDTPREDDVNIPGGCMCKEHEAAVRAMLAEARGERAS